MKYLICALLVASPLAAQDNTVITIQDTTVVNIFDNDSTFIFIEQAPRDSAQVARDEAAARAMSDIADYLENCGCVNQGTSRATQIATGGIAFFLGLIWWELRKGNKDGADGADGAAGKDGATGPTGPTGPPGEDASHDDDDDHSEGRGEGR
jgi:hypothetical protein